MGIMVYFTSFMYILNKNTLSLGYYTSLVIYKHENFTKKGDFGSFWPLFHHFFIFLGYKSGTYMDITIYFTSLMYILNKNTLSLGYYTSLGYYEHENFKKIVFLALFGFFLASFFISL